MQSNTSPYALQKLNFINTLNLKTCGFFSRSLQHWQLLICITASKISVQKHWIENLPDPHLTHGHTQFVKCKLPSSGLHSYSCWMHSASIPRTPTSLVVCLQGLAPPFSPPNQFISDAPSTKSHETELTIFWACTYRAFRNTSAQTGRSVTEN